MKTNCLALLSLLLTPFQTAPAGVAPAPNEPSTPQLGKPHAPAGSIRPREVLVKFRATDYDAAIVEHAAAAGGVADQAQRSTIARDLLGDAIRRHGLRAPRAVFPVARPIAKAAAADPQQMAEDRAVLERWFHLRTGEGGDPREIAAELRRHPAVEFAEPNHEWRLNWGFDPPLTDLPDGSTDPMYPEQWYLTFCNIQQTWDYMNTNGICGGGNSDVVVAVIDSGVDLDHEDLQANLWVNASEIPGNGIDDDGNGFIDDIHGCNVVSDPRSHSGDPTDLHGHGTHVAGVIAAQAFNGKGMIGTAFNTRIMAVRAAQYSGALAILDIAEGILYATEQGAEVINMSFGGYQRSLIVEDALKVALNQAVLVAAAGNDGQNAYPAYPAAIPWVIGVMSCNNTGGRSWFSNFNNPNKPTWYEVKAPGESILGPLPNGRYAKWSGTSMATPIVAGTAALMRSYFWQRDIYSNRFLMASIVNSNALKGHLDAYTAITTPPTPGVTMYRNWLFDDPAISPGNDGDGSVDAGETIHLALELINRSGSAENINLTLRARAQGAAIDDPYVTIDKGTSNVPTMGPWAIYDNGLVYDEDGVIVGVDDPLVFTVAEDCPNDHVIPFELTITFEDGWNDEETRTFTRISRWNYVVTRGKNVPKVIEEDMTLTKDEFWIVPGPVIVEEGVTLTITEGTQLQFGSISDDPYNPGPQNGYLVVEGNLDIAGTEEEPVNLFPSYLVAGQTTQIQTGGVGRRTMRYAEVMNPQISSFQEFDHCRFYWDNYNSTVVADLVTNTSFHKLRGAGSIQAKVCDTVLFEAGKNPAPPLVMRNTVFLQDNEGENPMSLQLRESFSDPLTNTRGDVPFWSAPRMHGGDTFVLLPMEHVSLRLAESIANFYGGNVGSVRSREEADFLESYLPTVANFRAHGSGNSDWVYIGLDDWQAPGDYKWLDGSALDFRDWAPGHPPDIISGAEHLTQILQVWNNGRTLEWGWRSVTQSDSIRTGHGGVNSWKSFLIRMPGEWTVEQLNAPVEGGELLEFLKENFHQRMIRNAFLSKYWDADLNHWMRVVAPQGSNKTVVMKQNFWGTDSTELIDHMIVDYYDTFTRGKINYGTPPATGAPETYPFVDGVFINDVPAQTVPEVGSGLCTFRVRFNRDMSMAEEDVPFVTFGPSPPYTDFSVKPIDNGNSGWIDARNWEGTFYVVPVTGDGYHCMRISGAVAADDPWLVSGYDVGRFRFEVKTMGVLAMTLHASGAEGRIELDWQQDDFDLLAGYNLYRSDSAEGNYVRINDTIIPPGEEHFIDRDVTPAVPMYYRFSVLQTDYSESKLSNVATAAPSDTIAPELIHTPVFEAVAGSNLRITAAATDNVRVEEVTLHYRPIGGSDYQDLGMLNTGGDLWTVSIPGSGVAAPGIEYYLTCSDGISVIFSGNPTLPHSVAVAEIPRISSVTPNSGPTGGGTSVTLSGTLFQDGAEVYFGLEPAAEVEFLNSSRLRAVSPPHFPGLVDIKVVNPDSSECVRPNAFTFVDESVVLSLPELVADYGSVVDVPVELTDINGWLAGSFTVNFDPTVLKVVEVSKGGWIPDWSFSSNTTNPGTVQLSMAGATPVTGSGSPAVIRFEVTGSPPASSPLSFASSDLNDGAISHLTDNGSLVVNGFFSVGGTVSYYGGGSVPGVTLTLAGGSEVFETLSSAEGTFEIADVPVGGYRLTPDKPDGAAEITAYDASLILQADAGLLSLTADQQTAADVNRNQLISAMDASYILQKAVDLIPLPFPGGPDVWSFSPELREYPLLNDNQADQDFSAVLIGDVSGNWNAESASGLHGGAVADVSLPEQEVTRGQVIGVPLAVSFEEDAEIYSADIAIQYDPVRLRSEAVTAGEMVGLNGMAMVTNTNQPGLIRIAVAGANPMVFDGTLAVLEFSEIQAGTDSIPLRFTETSLNEDAIETRSTDGLLTIHEVEPAPYDAWTSRKFTHPFDDLLPTSDPDNDLLSNLLEFAFGTDPTVADAAALHWAGGTTDRVVAGTPAVTPSKTAGAATEFKARFMRRRNDPGDSGSVRYAWRFSSDLTDWESSADHPGWRVDPVVVAVDESGEYELVEVPYPQHLDNGKAPRFFQVEVSLVP